jgi:glycosyltransferase involved in cell wall biosynthesis
VDALILTTEPLPLPGGVTTGAGLRAWGLAEGLRSAGLDAWIATRAVAMPNLDKTEAQRHRVLLWEPDTVASLTEEHDPACIVSQHWGLLADVPPLARPLAIDLAGPHLLERRLWGAEDWAGELEQKLAALRRADFVVCSGERQRLYFFNHLAMAGFELDANSLPVIPFSVSPELPEPQSAPDQFAYGGMFLPWQDPRTALEAVVETLEAEKRGRLHVWGGPHPRLDQSRGRFEALMDRLEASDRVETHTLTAFDDYVAALSRMGVAVDVMARNPERELAFTTRTVVYLWAGLPVIHADHDELGPIIAAANAGWVLRADDTDSLRGIVREILASPDQVAERAANAQRLVRENLTWDKTIEPLAAWCREPKLRDNRLSVSLAFETKDRELARLEAENRRLDAELATLRGKLSVRVAQGLVSLRWLWAPLVWLALMPLCLALGLVAAVIDLLPPRRDAVRFPPPPGKSVDTRAPSTDKSA